MERRRGARSVRPRLRRDSTGSSARRRSVYARGRELKPGLWNDIHALVDYGGVDAFVEGSEFMPQGYPFTAALKVLCEGGVVEFMFRAGGVSVEMGGGSSLIVHESGKAYPLPI